MKLKQFNNPTEIGAAVSGLPLEQALIVLRSQSDNAMLDVIRQTANGQNVGLTLGDLRSFYNIYQTAIQVEPQAEKEQAATPEKETIQ